MRYPLDVLLHEYGYKFCNYPSTSSYPIIIIFAVIKTGLVTVLIDLISVRTLDLKVSSGLPKVGSELPNNLLINRSSCRIETAFNKSTIT